MRTFFSRMRALLFLLCWPAAGAAFAQSGAVIGQPQNAPAMLISSNPESGDRGGERSTGRSAPAQARQAQADGHAAPASTRKRRSAAEGCQAGERQPAHGGRRNGASGCAQDKGNERRAAG